MAENFQLSDDLGIVSTTQSHIAFQGQPTSNDWPVEEEKGLAILANLGQLWRVILDPELPVGLAEATTD